MDYGQTHVNFKKNLGKIKILKKNPLGVINSKQQVVLGEIKDAFEGENIQTEYSGIGC